MSVRARAHMVFMDFGEPRRMPDLSPIGERERLKPKASDEQHWQRLRHGVYLGYCPSKQMAGGTWFARVDGPDTTRNARKRLGDYAPARWQG